MSLASSIIHKLLQMTRHANAAWQVYAAFLFIRVETLVRPAYSKMWHTLSFFCQILFWNQCPVVLLALGGRWLSRQKREGSVLKTFFQSHSQWSLPSFCEHGLLLVQFIRNRAMKTLLAWVHLLCGFGPGRRCEPIRGLIVSRTWLPPVRNLWLATSG